jgi:hypothetical protein
MATKATFMLVSVADRTMTVLAAIFVVLMLLPSTAFPADADNGFAPMSEAESLLFFNREEVPVPRTVGPRIELLDSYTGAALTRATAACADDDFTPRCKSVVLYISQVSREGTYAYSFRTPASFGWQIDRIEEVELAPGKSCFLITMSEELRGEGLRDGPSGRWPRRASQVCVDTASRYLSDEYNGDITPLTTWEQNALLSTIISTYGSTSRTASASAEDKTPWKISIFLPEWGECSNQPEPVCDAAYVAISDDSGKRFSFHSRLGYLWDVTEIRTFVDAASQPVCALMTFQEYIYSAGGTIKYRE